MFYYELPCIFRGMLAIDSNGTLAHVRFSVGCIILLGMIYLLTAVELKRGGNSTVNIYKKQYIGQHNETEYIEENVYNNKNT
jgi:hypothetical protein